MLSENMTIGDIGDFGPIVAPLENQGNHKSVIVQGNAMLPLYRHGDHLIVVEDMPIKIGDRVAIGTSHQVSIAGTLVFRDSEELVVKVGGVSRKSTIIETKDIQFIARIVWASQ